MATARCSSSTWCCSSRCSSSAATAAARSVSISRRRRAWSRWRWPFSAAACRSRSGGVLGQQIGHAQHRADTGLHDHQKRTTQFSDQWSEAIDFWGRPVGTDPTEAELEPITEPAEHRILMRLLHDMGVVVAHGLTRDASAAEREITLLDPNWLTTAIYMLLNSRLVSENSGEFSRSDLDLLLDPAEYPHDRHEFIIGMMEHPEIALCFRLRNHSGKQNNERFLIPAALTKIEPEYQDIWQESSSLRFRFDYDFLPPTMLARFIVESHAYVTATRWRTGVVLRTEECPVLVRIPTNSRRIDILITGPNHNRAHALSVVRSNFDVVHNLNPECGSKARVPLPDQPELDVSFKHLQKLSANPKLGMDYEFFPEDADRSYTVGELFGQMRSD